MSLGSTAMGAVLPVWAASIRASTDGAGGSGRSNGGCLAKPGYVEAGMKVGSDLAGQCYGD